MPITLLMAHDERRHNYRVETERAVVCYGVDDHGHLGDPMPATTVDLSANGAALQFAQPTRVGARVCLQLRFAHPPLDLIVFGRPVRAPRPGLVAIRFEGLKPEARRQLTRFVFGEAKRIGQGATDSAASTDDTPLPAEPRKPKTSLSVAEFAQQINQTVGSTRRLLNKGLVPGARRIDPTAKKSHWIIPLNAPEEYLALFRAQDGGAAGLALAQQKR